MGKRSAFTRKKNDAYDTTDPRAVQALLPHLPAGSRFVEPCAGKGDLVRQLEAAGHLCVGAIDIEPRGEGIGPGDAARFVMAKHYFGCDLFITNPPWTTELLHPIIFNLFWQAPTWMLLGADYAHNIASAPYMGLCRDIVSVGRLKWEPGSAHQSTDNCCWYLFAAGARPVFHGRRG